MTDIVERARFLAAGQDDPHSVTITELCDRIEVLESALEQIWNHTSGHFPAPNAVISAVHKVAASTQSMET